MTRTLGDLATHLAERAHSLCYLLRLDLRDGTTIALTDHDGDIDFDLGDGEATYSPVDGVRVSDVVLALGMDAGNFEITGPIGDTFPRAGIVGGRFHAARARLFFINWSDPGEPARIMAGRVSAPRAEGGSFTMEVRDHADAFNQTIGRVVSPYCTHDFGDERCGIVRTGYAATITAVTSAYQVTVSISPDDHFHDMGTLAFDDGEMAGVEMEIFAQIGGALELYTGLPGLPAVGDAVTLYRGCSKLRLSDDAAVPTCLSYGNVVNFPGFPDAPGTETYMKIAEPGGGSSDGHFSGGTLSGGSSGGLTPGA